jgi:polysaccharide biosynthesis/export protein
MFMNRHGYKLLLLLLLCAWPAIAQPTGNVNTNPASAPPVEQGALSPLSPEAHILRPGDRIEFNIASLPEMPTVYDIRVDGHFYHPLVGDVEANGRTLSDLRTILLAKLSKELRNPTFRLGIIQVAQHQVAVLGEAQNQGTFLVGVGASVLDVIAKAGGLTQKADSKRAVLLRGDDRVEVSLEPEHGGGLTKVRTGDILYILAGSPVSVAGEVTMPGVYSVSRVSGDPRNAILAAGGAKEEASLKRVRLIRASLPEPLILDLSPESEEPLPEAAQLLQEGDILVVPARQAVLLGAVANPGPVPLRGDETLLDLIPARVNEASDIKHIMVVRADDVQKNRDEKEEYNLEEYFKEGKADIVVPIYDGDLVYVPPKSKGGGFFGKFQSIFSIIGIARWFL